MPTSSRNRPIRVTILALLAFWIAVWNSVRLVNAIVFWKTLKGYGASPWYVAVSGGIWVAAGIIIGMGLWRGKPWAWVAAFGGTAGYGSWYWFDRLILQEPRANWPFAIAVTVFFLVVVTLILITRQTRIYFRRIKL